MVGLPSIIARYEQQETLAHIERIIVDREGMGTEFLASLHARSDEQWSRSCLPISIEISPPSLMWEPSCR